MNKAEKQSLTAVPIVILIGAGVAFAGSQGGKEINGFPIFALSVTIVFAFQWIAFIPAYINKTEKFYDLTGSITYVTVTITAVLLSQPADARSYLFLAIIVIWAVRLGSFLFSRIHDTGEDRRFREIKKSFGRFLIAWTLQGLWVTFSLAAGLAAITSEKRVDLGIFAAVGFIVWLFGFGIEVIADRQKSKFRADSKNNDKFISTGLWSWSRHPNYFGEIVLWIGVAIIALPILKGWQWATMISPIFIFILLTRISGVPMLENRADKKWGGQADYENYMARTSVLIPRPPSTLQEE